MRSSRPLARRIWAVLGGISIRSKIMGMVVGLTLVLGLGITVQVRAALRQTLVDELSQRGVSVARDLAARGTESVLVNDTYALHRLIRDTEANSLDLSYAFLQDARGNVVAHSFAQDGGGGTFPVSLLAVNTADPSARVRQQTIETNEGRIHDFAVPLLEGKAGTARVGLSEARIDSMVDDVTRRLLLITAGVAFIGVAAAAFLTWILTEPVLNLVAVTRSVARGDLDLKARVRADDEIGRLGRAVNQMVDDLSAAREANERYLDVLRDREALRGQLLDKVIQAQEDERRRIARELHDQTGQALTSLMLGLRVMGRATDDQAAHEQAETLHSEAAAALEDVRRLSLELRPSMLDDKGLEPALKRYTRDFRGASGLRVDFDVIGLNGTRLLPRAETALYRIVQEALVNVARHADAEAVSVLLERHGGRLRLIVEDDGCGFDAETLLESAPLEAKLGLYGMLERAALAGGELSIESRPGSGTTVFVDLPLETVEDRS